MTACHTHDAMYPEPGADEHAGVEGTTDGYLGAVTGKVTQCSHSQAHGSLSVGHAVEHLLFGSGGKRPGGKVGVARAGMANEVHMGVHQPGQNAQLGPAESGAVVTVVIRSPSQANVHGPMSWRPSQTVMPSMRRSCSFGGIWNSGRMGPGARCGSQADGAGRLVGLAGPGARRPPYCRRRFHATESEGAPNETNKPVMGTDAATATWPEADDARHHGRPVVLPFGALEQHGPHLPLSTDTLMATWMAEHVCDAIGGWLLPPLPYGDTAANNGFAGTVSLSFDTVRAIAVDICRSLERAGFSCLIILNGDYGNRPRSAWRHATSLPGTPGRCWSSTTRAWPRSPPMCAKRRLPAPRSSTPMRSRPRSSWPFAPIWCTWTGRLPAIRRCRPRSGPCPPTLPPYPPQASSATLGGPAWDKGRRLLELLGEQAVALARSFLVSVGRGS